MIREVRYVTTSFESLREDHPLGAGGYFLGALGGVTTIVPAGFVWLVDRIYYRFGDPAAPGPVRLFSTSEASSARYFGDAVDAFVLPAGEAYPQDNTADEFNPVIIPEGRHFILEALGTANDRIYINVAYRIAQLQQIWTPEAITAIDAASGDHPAGSGLRPPDVHSRRPYV